jgi:hypothetical protein
LEFFGWVLEWNWGRWFRVLLGGEIGEGLGLGLEEWRIWICFWRSSCLIAGI